MTASEMFATTYYTYLNICKPLDPAIPSVTDPGGMSTCVPKMCARDTSTIYNSPRMEITIHPSVMDG